MITQPADNQSPCKNHLLAALPQEDFDRLKLELVTMPLGEMIYEPGRQMQHAYFPTTSIVSLHYVTESGSSAETAGVGNEGVVGVPIFMGGESTSSSAVVQTAGQAYRLESQHLKKRVFPWCFPAAIAAALHPGPDDTNGAVCGLLSTSFCRAASVSVVVVDSGSL